MGTGLFGNAVLKRFLQTDIGEISFIRVMKKTRWYEKRISKENDRCC